jgi:hypothetical protein
MLRFNSPSIRWRRVGTTHRLVRLRLVGGAHPTNRARLFVAVMASCFLSSINSGSCVLAQAPAPAAVPQAALPEVIYWKQHLFLIPYQWGSAAEPGAAQAVWLFISKDRGTSWRKISEAKPEVKSFNYRAEADGEYWFAVRTFDKQGRAWPQGPYQPELRVIVDTTIPRIDELRARLGENGVVNIQGRAMDVNLDASSVKFEWQADPTAAWQPVMLQTAPVIQPVAAAGYAAGGAQLHAYWQPPAGPRPTALRGIIADRAGNSAIYQARIESGPVLSGPLLSAPVTSTTAPAVQAAPIQSAPTGASNTTAIAPPRGWVSGGPSQTQSGQAAAPPETPPTSQPWPAANIGRAPFRLWTGGSAQHDDGVTAYGTPPLFDGPLSTLASSERRREEPRIEARFAAVANPTADSANNAVPANANRPQFATLEPYRETTTVQPPAAAPAPSNDFAWPAPSTPIARDVTPVDSQTSPQGPPSQPKLVGSRTFALEYDLDDAGRGGVSKVELWGTRDSGKTWTRYAQDDDNRSPLIVTVDDEGMYGFRILVQNAGVASVEPPRAGDAPELWVSVDLKRPVVELTAIERGQGNQADHLILRWRAADGNLESRPIAIFYSSRPAGPWSAIATNLENTGEYAWRVERYVPTRFYLRIEARDTAGNLAAFQTREPVEFSASNLAGRLRSAQPVGPAAVGTSDSYR